MKKLIEWSLKLYMLLLLHIYFFSKFKKRDFLRFFCFVAYVFSNYAAVQCMYWLKLKSCHRKNILSSCRNSGKNAKACNKHATYCFKGETCRHLDLCHINQYLHQLINIGGNLKKF